MSEKFSINKESMKELIKDKNCRKFIHIMNNSNRNKIVKKYEKRLYSYIKKKYNCKQVNIGFDVLIPIRLSMGSKFKINTK